MDWRASHLGPDDKDEWAGRCTVTLQGRLGWSCCRLGEELAWYTEHEADALSIRYP